MFIPKANGKVTLCLDPAWLNEALIKHIHRGPTLNDILPKLNNIKYLSLIDASFGYHNLRLDLPANLKDTDISNYCLEQEQQVICFSKKLMRTFHDMTNIFGITDDILVVGYENNVRDYNEMV